MKIDDTSKLAFFNSKQVSVYPCANRGTIKGEPAIKVNDAVSISANVYDSEARFLTENNLANRLAGNSSFENNTYIKSWSDTELECVIKGYTFKIIAEDAKTRTLLKELIEALNDSTFNGATSAYLKIVLGSKAINKPDSDKQLFETLMLEGQYSNASAPADSKLDINDSGTDIFTGVTLCTTKPTEPVTNEYYLKILNKSNDSWQQVAKPVTINENGNITTTGTISGATLNGKLGSDDAVKTNNITNNAVTNAKIADNAVTADKIDYDAVTTEKIAANAVTNAKLKNSSIEIGSTEIELGDTATDISGVNRLSATSGDIDTIIANYFSSNFLALHNNNINLWNENQISCPVNVPLDIEQQYLKPDRTYIIIQSTIKSTDISDYSRPELTIETAESGSIDWGDGSAPVGSGTYSHKYENCGKFIISVENFRRITSATNCSIEVKLADNSTSIEHEAFKQCLALKSIEISPTSGIFTGVQSIGMNAFYGCTSLTNITIPDSVTFIGGSAFSGCSALVSVIIPSSVTSLGTDSFKGCSNLTKLSAPLNIIEIIKETVWGPEFLKQVRELTISALESSNSEITEGLFEGYTSLNSVVLEKPITTIGKGAFKGCTGLTSVVIGNSVTSIGNNAFEDCTGLTSVEIPSSIEIPSSVTTIGGLAFKGCTGLKSIEIPSSVTTIGYEAFRGCCGLTSVEIPSSVTLIENFAFYGCSSLTSVVIPNNVTSIGEWAFYNCSSLTSVTIPDGVTSIGDQAFSRCSGLTSVVIPNSVSTIGWYAFGNCLALANVKIEGNPKIDETAFKGTLRNALDDMNGNIWGNEYGLAIQGKHICGNTTKYIDFRY